jgi:hypothetical protein
MRTSTCARSINRLVVFIMLLGLQACAPSWKRVTSPTPPITLSRVYVYSFLDLVTDDLGPRRIDAINRQLIAALESRGVATELHLFRDDPIGSGFARVQGAAPVQELGGLRTVSSERIPVSQVIAGNAANERRFGADYRLIVFPAEVSHSEWGRGYTFTWMLYETQTHRRVWDTWSRTSQVSIMRLNEYGLAERLVNGLIQQMSTAGLLR